MTVIFSLLVIVCGVISSLCFASGGIGAGFLFLVITLLSIAGLVGRILYEKGIFNSLSKKAEPTNYSIPTPEDNTAEEIKKYKELLDSGAITEEEYEAKKKQLLKL